MVTHLGQRAIEEAVKHGNAIFKFISANDVGKTGSHQYGYYLPKAIWEMYTPQPPEKGKNYDHIVKILWQNGRETESCIKWYGKRTRSEYRLTRFGDDFPFLTDGNIGDLLVLIRVDETNFKAFVLDLEEDIEEIQAALKFELAGTWAAFRFGKEEKRLTEDACIGTSFRKFLEGIKDFPPTTDFSEAIQKTLINCVRDFKSKEPDYKILRLTEEEFSLFRLVERHLYQNEITRAFKSVDDFIATAMPIINRRKARAGRSLENHFEYILNYHGIPHVIRPKVDGKPDVVIPSLKAYEDPAYDPEKLFMVEVKTTCKERWKQVLSEAKRIRKKHILTLQQGISSKQLNDMFNSNVALIVPKRLQKHYPPERDIEIFTIAEFFKKIKRIYQ